MADGSIAFDTKIDNSEAHKELLRIKKEIEKFEKDIEKSKAAKLPLVDQANELGVKLDEAKAKLEDLQKQQGVIGQALNGEDPQAYIDAYAQKPEIASAVAAQQAEVASLQKKWDAVNLKIDNYNRKITQATASITAQTGRAGVLTSKVTGLGASAANAMTKAKNAAAAFQARLLRIAKNVLVFSVLTRALSTVVKYFGKAARTNKEFSAQLAKLKGSLLTAFQPIYETLIPALISLMKIATAVVQVVAQVFSLLGRKSAVENAKNAKSLNEEANAIDNIGSSAKKASKTLAGFDEINTLGNSDDEGSAPSVGTSTPDFSDFSTDEYKTKIDELTVYLSGALLALGAILTFSGANIPLGIGLMAAGAVGLVTEIVANWNCMSEELRNAITLVLGVLGGASLAIGAILAFSGADVALGIGLMAAGAAALGTATALNWGTIQNALKGPIGGVVAIVSGALLAIGAVLVFSGAALPLGIGLIALGAVGLATTAAVNWDTIKMKLQGPLGKVVAIVSAALLAIGAILAFAGVALPLGLALIAAGAIGLVTTAVVNWGSIKNKVAAVISGIVAIVGGALLAIGVLLCLSGAGLPLGLALIAAGIATSYAAWKLNDNPLTRFIKKLANSVIDIINVVIAAINDMFHISFEGLKLLGKTVIPAFEARLINLPKIPHLAQGAVLPANKPFLAMVGDQKHGTNVEAPLETIKQALAEVMATQGGGDITINFTGDLAQLARVLKPQIDRENRRVGSSLITKGAY